MPKKPVEYKTNISIRVTNNQKEKWEDFADNNGFASVSSLARYAIDALVEQGVRERLRKETQDDIKERLKDMEQKYNDLLKSQQEIMKAIAQKATKKEDKPLREYQKGLIINLLEEKPRDEMELQIILSDLSEIEIIELINELIETSIIKRFEKDKNKYAVI